jgi:hypothetical protein
VFLCQEYAILSSTKVIHKSNPGYSYIYIYINIYIYYMYIYLCVYIYTQQIDQPCTKVGPSFINDSIILVGYNTTNVYSRKAARLRCPKQNTLYRYTFKKQNINMQIVMSAICISYIYIYMI